ncbi:hypothetical protein EW145_g151 [Phellinidium pouzarii]|uniref:ER membrane protein complex subunit 3 n=1 Tax=Phellinidium pouzarii TaxID=167371 RepID=A0A4S4LLH6_9AGAM|nr:hypothetical protein EW145_g151 [Phellinidium pouzarii]
MVGSQVSLYLDPQIRDWVLFPITLVMILVGILRHNVAMLLQSAPKKLSRAATREQRALLRSQILRESSAFSPVPPTYYRAISQYLNRAFEAGTYLKDGPPAAGETSAPPESALRSGRNGRYDVGYENAGGDDGPADGPHGLDQLLLPGLRAHQATFPPDTRFQVDVTARDRDTGHGHSAANSSRDMLMSPYSGGAAQAPAQPQDFVKLFKAERDNLKFAEGLYNWSGKDVELRVLRKYGRIPS